jgi:DNA-binding CsgD family transcriptional regulator
VGDMKKHSIPLLINFLKQPSLKYSDICIFLLNNIFTDHKFSCALISQVSKSGLIDVVGSFGLSETQKSALNGVSPISEHPLSQVLRENKPLLIKKFPNWPKEFVLKNASEIDEIYRTFFCLPIASNSTLFGTLTLFSTDILRISKQDMEFYSIIANMSILRFDSQHISRVLINTNSNVSNSILNVREIGIIDLIKQGKTNAEIAKVLGYSESTIRQDTIKIYRKLGISGRQDIYFLKEVN